MKHRLNNELALSRNDKNLFFILNDRIGHLSSQWPHCAQPYLAVS